MTGNRVKWMLRDKRTRRTIEQITAEAMADDGNSVNDALEGLMGGASGVMPWPVISGTVLDSRTVYAAETSEAAVTANRRYALPLIIRQACTIDSLGVRVKTGAAGVARFGLYEVILTAGADFGAPGALIGDYGTGDTQWSDNGVRVYPDIVLEPGVYFMVAAFQGTPTVQMLTPISQGPGGELEDATTRNACLYASGGYDALPATFGGLGGRLTAGPRLFVEISY